MLAKIECEGKVYPAILLDSTSGMERLEELKASLHSFIESSFVDGDPNTFLSEDLYNVFSLLHEMDLTEDQRFQMSSNYFNGKERKDHKTKTAQITF